MNHSHLLVNQLKGTQYLTARFNEQTIDSYSPSTVQALVKGLYLSMPFNHFLVKDTDPKIKIIITY